MSDREVKAEALMAVTAPQALDAFTEPDLLAGWWGVQRSLVEKKPGGCYTLAWNVSEKGFGYVSSGVVREYTPGNKLVVGNFTYLNPERAMLGPMMLAVSVKAEGRGSRLTVVQSGYQKGGDWDWYYEAVKTAWPQVLPVLRDYLEKKFPV